MRIATYIQDKYLEGILIFLLEKHFKVRVDSFTNLDEFKDIVAGVRPDFRGKAGEESEQDQVELVMIEGLTPEESQDLFLARGFDQVPRVIFEDGKILGVYQSEQRQGPSMSQISPRDFVSVIQNWVKHGLLPFELADSSQCRIRTDLLLEMGPLLGDVFVRLSDDKFVRLFKKGDVFDQDDLLKYTSKRGIEYLYIPRSQCGEFAARYAEKISQRISERRAGFPVLKTTEQAQSVLEVVHQLTHEVGFTQEVQSLTRAQMKLTIEVVRRSPDLGKMILRLAQKDHQYIAVHSTLCAYLSCMIANQLQWGSDWTYQKLVLASFIHDLPLQNQDLAALDSLSELEAMREKFTEDEQKLYQSHPELAAEMLRKMSEIPPDVDLIVLQHHEQPDGGGFPKGVTHAAIAPLSALFIIAHRLATFLMNSGGEMDLSLFLQDMRLNYSSGQFKKVLTAVEKLSLDL